MLGGLELSIPKLVFISANKEDAVKAFKQMLLIYFKTSRF
jgi:hypothetical protein